MADYESLKQWQIWIDTGGTFTDCIAFDPKGQLQRLKVLSNGSLKGKLIAGVGPATLKISASWPVKKDIFKGYTLYFSSNPDITYTIASYNSKEQTIHLQAPLINPHKNEEDFFITAHEEAPILASRLATETQVDQSLPAMIMKLGSTKGTNALLERKGAKVLFIVTKGFKDLLLIGDQQRPDLFNLNVKKPAPLFNNVIEVDERIDAEGNVLISLDDIKLLEIVEQLKLIDYEVVAITFINSYKNPVHEIKLFEYLRKNGIRYINYSHQLSKAIKIVPRANTTVINAYLTPIIHNYLEGINNNLGPDSELKVMTSTGGIVNYTSFLPKDSLLSGPAGGVVGGVISANLSGVKKIITFDMGGTSTDVARFDGTFDYRYETKIGDINMLSPSIAIETVAAGGGSICYFDGYSLKVGPHSAGAHPGPACYGSGGPLTITDVNLLLGRIDDSDFSIPLNKVAAEKALDKLINDMERASINVPDKNLLLAGCLNITNERMAETINKISVDKGFSTTDYALLAFGGAGGQHACAVAELLGINEIIIPFNAGLLSAFGIGNAAIERLVEKEILRPFDDIKDLDNIIAQLERDAKILLRNEGLKDEEIFISSNLLYLRFKGQDNGLEIEYQKSDDIISKFLSKYESLFNHHPVNLEVELASIKCLASSSPKDKFTQLKVDYKSSGKPPKHSLCFSDNKWVKIPVYSWADLKSGEKLTGNCILTNANTTIFIQKGWELTIDDNDNAMLRKDEQLLANTVQNEITSEAIQTELFTNRFRSIADDMGALLKRTSFSVNIKERLDFSCALLDQYGELIVNAPHIPVHLGSLGICVRKVVAVLNPGENDIIITNHPAYGGSHLPDITLIKPVYVNKKRIGYLANRAHHSEIGGSRPGSMPPNATRLIEEGVIITPMFLVKDGKIQFDELQNILTAPPFPTRSLNENFSDLKAGIASLNHGEKALINMCVNFGTQQVVKYMQKIKDKTANIIKAALIPFDNKIYKAEEKLDDGWKIKVTITIRNQFAKFDFRGTSSVHPGNFNATPAIVNSVILYVLRLLTSENLPLNEGICKAYDLILPECFLNPKFEENNDFNPAVVGGNTETSQRLTDTLIKALQLSACSQGTMNNLLFGNENFGYYETIGGGVGAGNGFDGSSAVHQHMTNTKITDPEILELRYPVRLDVFAIRENSGGDGIWKGGDGILRKITFLQKFALTILTQHRNISPFGMKDGSPGKVGHQFITTNDGKTIPLNGVDGYEILPGDQITIATPGGGGYGKIQQNS